MLTGGREDVIRAGIIGANPDRGWGSGVHRRVIASLPGFRLSAVCTTKQESAERAAALFGADHAFTDGRALAESPDVDLVSICVLAPHHHALAKAALEAGKHVYCEWPLALTVAQANELAALARERGVKAMIGLHLRGAPALRHAAALIAQGFVGRVLSVNLHVRVPGPIMRAMAMRSGGTTLTSIYGGHLVDAIDHYFGPVGAFAARSAIHLPPVDEAGQPVVRDAADQLLVQGNLQDGALFSFDLGGASMAALGSCWRIEGSEGALLLASTAPDMPAMEALTLHGARLGEAMRPLPTPPEHDCPAIPAEPDRYSAYPGVLASRAALASIGTLYGELGHAIRWDGPVAPDFSRAAYVQQLVENIDRAAGASSPARSSQEIAA